MPVYSHSRLQTYENCPQQYKLKYIDRIKPPAGEEGRKELEQFIKKSGIWEEVSGLNLARLQKFLDDEELDKKIRNGLLKFAEEIEKTSVRLVKKREEEEE